MKELKPKNKFCYVEGSSFLIKSFALKFSYSFVKSAMSKKVVGIGEKAVPQQCDERGLHQKQTPWQRRASPWSGKQHRGQWEIGSDLQEQGSLFQGRWWRGCPGSRCASCLTPWSHTTSCRTSSPPKWPKQTIAIFLREIWTERTISWSVSSRLLIFWHF